MQEKTLNDLGYLDQNEENLLGYLKHVSLNLGLLHVLPLTWLLE